MRARYQIVVSDNGMLTDHIEANRVDIRSDDDKITITVPNGKRAKREDIISTLVQTYACLPAAERDKLPQDIRKMLTELCHIQHTDNHG